MSLRCLAVLAREVAKTCSCEHIETNVTYSDVYVGILFTGRLTG